MDTLMGMDIHMDTLTTTRLMLRSNTITIMITATITAMTMIMTTSMKELMAMLYTLSLTQLITTTMLVSEFFTFNTHSIPIVD